MPIQVVLFPILEEEWNGFPLFLHIRLLYVVSLKANAAHAEPTFLSTIGGLYSNGINFGSSGRNDKISLNSMDLGFEVPFADSDSVFWTEGGARILVCLYQCKLVDNSKR